MEEGKIDVIQKAKELLLASPVMRYGVTAERLDAVFSNFHMLSTQEELLQEYNPYRKYDGRLDGFNRNHHCYFGPEATPHFVIHEVLHELSSQFDEQGHRTVNGIAKDNSYSQILLNEGMIDYVASKISGEEVLHYAREKTVIARLEPMLLKQSRNPDILFQILLQDKNRINEFIADFAKPEIADKIINRFEFMSTDNINMAMSQIEKRFNRHHTFEQIKAKISSIFHPKKALPPGTVETLQQSTQGQPDSARKWREAQKFEVKGYTTKQDMQGQEKETLSPIKDDEEQSL